MKQKCIFCGIDLTHSYSKEHIIFANIGGKLKSNKIICKKCNNQFGTELDDELIKKFGIFDDLLNIKKERGKTATVIADYNGKKYRLKQGEPVLKDPYPIYDNDEKLRSMVYPNEKIARKALKKKKVPNLKIEEVIKNAIKENQNFQKPLKIKINGIDDKTWRACGKIVYEFLCDKISWYKPSTSNFLDFIKGGLDPKDFSICFGYINFNPIKKNENNIYHLIVVEGRKDEGIVIGYLEIFNFFKVIMLIDKNYTSKPFLEGYYHDLIEQDYNHFKPKSKIPINQKELEDLFNDCINIRNLNYFKQELGGAIQLAKYYRIKENTQEKILKKYKDQSITISDLEKIIKDLLIEELKKFGLKN